MPRMRSTPPVHKQAMASHRRAAVLILAWTLAGGVLCFPANSLAGEEDAASQLASAMKQLSDAYFDYYDVKYLRETGRVYSIARKRLTRSGNRSFVDATLRGFSRDEGISVPADHQDPIFWEAIEASLAAPEAGRSMYLWDGLRFTHFRAEKTPTHELQWSGVRAKTTYPGLYKPSFLQGTYELVGVTLHEVMVNQGLETRTPYREGFICAVAHPRAAKTAFVLFFARPAALLPAGCLILRGLEAAQVQERLSTIKTPLSVDAWGKYAWTLDHVSDWVQEGTKPTLPQFIDRIAGHNSTDEDPTRQPSHLNTILRLMEVRWSPEERSWGPLPEELHGQKVPVMDELLRTIQVYQPDGSVLDGTFPPSKPVVRPEGKDQSSSGQSGGMGQRLLPVWLGGFGACAVLFLWILYGMRKGSIRDRHRGLLSGGPQAGD